MKTFLEDLGKRIGETAEIVGNKANEAMEVQKLKSQIRALERGNESDFEDLGRMVYEKFRNGESLDEEAAALCEAIQSREESITEYTEQIADVKGDVKCEVCGKSVAKEMAYCPYCGEKVPKSAPTEEDFADEPESFAEKAEDMAEKAADVIDETAETAAEMADAAKDAACNAAGKVAEKVEDAAESVKEKVEDIVTEKE